MYRKSIVTFTIAAAATLLNTGLPSAAEWELKGSWRVNVTCRDFTQTNNITIGRADRSKVLGTTNVDDGFGKIGQGAFDGKNFVFANTYSYNGGSYEEIWRGSLSNNGQSFRGTFKTNNTESGGCSYHGQRV